MSESQGVMNRLTILPDDLVVRGDGPTTFKICNKKLLSIVETTIVELNDDFGGGDAYTAASDICHENPGFVERYGFKNIRAIAESLHCADVVSLSTEYTKLFDEFNARYFSNRLPRYEVRVVFDIHRAADEPTDYGSVSSGLHRPEEKCIYIRYTTAFPMAEMLIHEMAHAVTGGAHNEEWLSEMSRLQRGGAPVADWIFSSLAPMPVDERHKVCQSAFANTRGFDVSFVRRRRR